MKLYTYTLRNANNDADIHEFIEAKDIADAYGKVLAVTAKLNKKSPDYVWTLQNIENAYFVGAEDDAESTG